MKRSATGIQACTALGLLALLPVLRGSCTGGSGAAPGCGEGISLPPLCQAWLLEFGTDRTKVAAAGVVQDLVIWVNGGCSSEIQYALSIGAFPALQVKIKPFELDLDTTLNPHWKNQHQIISHSPYCKDIGLGGRPPCVGQLSPQNICD